MTTEVSECSYLVLKAPSGYLGKSQADGSLIYCMSKMEDAMHIDSPETAQQLMAEPLTDPSLRPVPREKIDVFKVSKKTVINISKIDL